MLILYTNTLDLFFYVGGHVGFCLKFCVVSHFVCWQDFYVDTLALDLDAFNFYVDTLVLYVDSLGRYIEKFVSMLTNYILNVVVLDLNAFYDNTLTGWFYLSTSCFCM